MIDPTKRIFSSVKICKNFTTEQKIITFKIEKLFWHFDWTKIWFFFQYLQKQIENIKKNQKKKTKHVKPFYGKSVYSDCLNFSSSVLLFLTTLLAIPFYTVSHFVFVCISILPKNSRCRLMGSLWDRKKLITTSDW